MTIDFVCPVCGSVILPQDSECECCGESLKEKIGTIVSEKLTAELSHIELSFERIEGYFKDANREENSQKKSELFSTLEQSVADDKEALESIKVYLAQYVKDGADSSLLNSKISAAEKKLNEFQKRAKKAKKQAEKPKQIENQQAWGKGSSTSTSESEKKDFPKRIEPAAPKSTVSDEKKNKKNKEKKKRKLLRFKLALFLGSKKGTAAAVSVSIFETTLLLFVLHGHFLKTTPQPWIAASISSVFLGVFILLLNNFLVTLPFKWFFQMKDSEAPRRKVIGVLCEIVICLCIAGFFFTPFGKTQVRNVDKMLYTSFKEHKNYKGAAFMLRKMGYDLNSKSMQKYTKAVLKKAEKGDKVYLSSEKYEEDYKFRSSAWTVLERKKNKVLVLSPWYSYNNKSFSGVKDGVWKGSSLEKGVNIITKYYISPFAQKMIVKTTVKTAKDETKDTLFPLTMGEFQKYRGFSTLSFSPFLLRDSSKKNTYHAFLNIVFKNKIFDEDTKGVRFAVWLDVSKV